MYFLFLFFTLSLLRVWGLTESRCPGTPGTSGMWNGSPGLWYHPCSCTCVWGSRWGGLVAIMYIAWLVNVCVYTCTFCNICECVFILDTVHIHASCTAEYFTFSTALLWPVSVRSHMRTIFSLRHTIQKIWVKFLLIKFIYMHANVKYDYASSWGAFCALSAGELGGSEILLMTE
jgi:hypothetical protein